MGEELVVVVLAVTPKPIVYKYIIILSNRHCVQCVSLSKFGDKEVLLHLESARS